MIIFFNIIKQVIVNTVIENTISCCTCFDCVYIWTFMSEKEQYYSQFYYHLLSLMDKQALFYVGVLHGKTKRLTTISALNVKQRQNW